MGSIFFAQLAAGVLLVSLLVRRKDTGRRFFAFTAELCLALLVFAVLLHPGARPDVADPLPAWRNAGPPAAYCAYLVAALLLLWYRARLGGLAGGRGQWVLWVAGGLGLLGSLADAQALLGTGTAVQLGLWLLSFAVSAMLLGSVTGAMKLGHFYLIIPGLSIEPLRRVLLAFGICLLLRAGLLGLALACGYGPELVGLDLETLIFASRILVGLVVPGVLWYLTLRTLRLHATQSATGILYAATVLVMLGELMSGSQAAGQAVLL